MDTHCHLQLPQYDKDRKEVINRAKRKHVEKIIIPGIDLSPSKAAIALTHEYPGIIYAAVGIHPYTVTKRFSQQSRVKTLEKLTSQKGVVAIGEIGLDYFHHHASELKFRQRELFILQLELAQKLNLPVIIHCRDAWEDLLSILSNFSIRGVVHCFSGGGMHLKKIIRLGYFIGITGTITYNTMLPEVIKEVPFEHLLVETDAPYLTPKPFRGQRNEPAYITYIVDSLAKLYHQSPQQIGEVTSQNAINLFSL